MERISYNIANFTNSVQSGTFAPTTAPSVRFLLEPMSIFLFRAVDSTIPFTIVSVIIRFNCNYIVRPFSFFLKNRYSIKIGNGFMELLHEVEYLLCADMILA